MVCREANCAEPEAESIDPRWHQALPLLLLSQTLAHAGEHVPFYARRWAEGGVSPSDLLYLGDLRRFPLVRKADIVVHRDTMINPLWPIHGTRCTSGTTGHRLRIFSNSEESEAVELLRALRDGRPSSGQRVIALRVMSAARRTLSTGSGKGASHVVPLTVVYPTLNPINVIFDATDTVLEHLTERYPVRDSSGRVEIMHITPPFLFDMIDAHLEQRGIDVSELSPSVIGISGGFLSTHTRERIQRAWGAHCHTTFSMSELNGAADELADLPGAFRFDPSVHAEIVHPTSLEHVAPGETGLLVVSGLYPFHKVMPFIRYVTGDVVERVNAGPGPVAFRWIGRESDTVDVSALLGRSVQLGSGDLIDAMYGLPAVPTQPAPRFRFEVVGSPLVLRVEVETHDPRATDLSDSIRQRLLRQVRVAELVEGGMGLEVCPVVKGSLAAPCRFYPSR
jgi:phenylacetate-coenzyme A ligase PaaK-like adenylate-forming protein